jgi:hypothetical protein
VFADLPDADHADAYFICHESSAKRKEEKKNLTQRCKEAKERRKGLDAKVQRAQSFAKSIFQNLPLRCFAIFASLRRLVIFSASVR